MPKRTPRILLNLFILFTVCCLAPSVHAAVSLPSPLINPLGKLKKYKSAIFRENDTKTLSYQEKDGIPVSRPVTGEVWILDVPPADTGKEPFSQLAQQIVSLHGSVLEHTDQEMVAEVSGTPGETWWAIASRQRQGYRLTVIREWQLLPGHALSWSMGKGGSKVVDFSTFSQGKRRQSITVQLPDGEVKVDLKTEHRFGNYQRQIAYHKRLSAKDGNTFLLFDIPQEEGWQNWSISRPQTAPPAKISVSLEEETALTPVEYGQQLGALRVRGIAYGRAVVEPAGGSRVNHPEYNRYSLAGDLTPDGDTIFWLPAGRWRVKVSPKNYPAVRFCETNIVPVDSGKTTVLDMPPSLTSAFTTAKGGIKITDAGEAKGKGIVTFTLLDQAAGDLTPTPDNVKILEGGQKVKVEKVQMVKTPPSVVLLLDSSGSMKKSMAKTLSAASRFIKSLPNNANIQVVDFATQPKLLNGSSKKEILAALSKVQARGATALYDAILKGLSLLTNEQRPSLLVFTDGVDANANDTGPGSKATQKDVLQAVEKAGIPLFTIGFGAKHDSSTLTRLASLSGGRYYAAKDNSALDKVFSVIQNNLGHTYQAEYARPQKAAPADIPVMSLVVDISGSMASKPAGCKNCDSRINQVKKVFHDFLLPLPEPFIAQFQSFNGTSTISQVMTSRKSELLEALGGLSPDGGTAILDAVKTAFETLKPVPSTKKFLIFVTDEALEVTKGEQKEFTTLLQKIRDQNIRVIWVGLGVDKAKKAFAAAAELSGGKFVLSEDPTILANAFQELLGKVNQAIPTGKTVVNLTVSQRTKMGEARSYGDSVLAALTPPAVTDQQSIPESANYQAGQPLVQYDQEVAKMVSGDDLPIQEVQVSKRIPLNVQAGNKAVKLDVDEVLCFSRLKGIEAPHGKRFLALTMEFRNILPEQEVVVYPDGSNHPAALVSGKAEADSKRVRMKPTYLIPDLKSHLFLRLNNKAMYPVSTATWLAGEPLILPGERSLAVAPEKPVAGTCIFLAPDEPIEQASLHFYDTAYGHFNLPLIGKLIPEDHVLTELPATRPVRMTDAFDITLRGMKDLTKIDARESDKGSTFRIVEADITSKVQALLDIKPAKIFSLRLASKQGYLYVPLHPITELLPMGFVQPTMMAPGSFNRVRFAFQIPQALAQKQKGELFIELKGKDVILPLGGKPGPSVKVDAAKAVRSEGADLVINEIGRIGKIGRERGDFVVIDLTLADKEDGYSSQLPQGFTLLRDDYQGKAYSQVDVRAQEKSKGLGGFSNNQAIIRYALPEDGLTDRLLFGFGKNTVVADGVNRRGVVVFRIPKDGAKHQWTLSSPYFSDLKVKVPNRSYQEKALLVQSPEDVAGGVDKRFAEELGKAVRKIIKEREARLAQKPGAVHAAKVDLNGGAPKETVPAPVLTLGGARKFAAIKTIGKLQEVLQRVRWLPAFRPDGWRYRYAPDAVLTQGWGTEADFANMAEIVLSRMGCASEKMMVQVTPEGQKTLAKLGKVNQVNTRELPCIRYAGSDGNDHLLVFPFMKEMADLKGLVNPFDREKRFYSGSATASIYVSLLAETKNVDRNVQIRDLGAALAGGASGKGVQKINVLNQAVPLSTLSLDAVDLGYAVVGKKEGDLYTAALETADDSVVGKGVVDTGVYRIVGEEIEIRLPGETFSKKILFQDGEGVDSIFHAIGINLPDVAPWAAKELADNAQQRFSASRHPDAVSALRWYTHEIIDHFLVAQSRYEKSLAEKLALTVGRTEKSRCLLVTVRRPKTAEKVQTSLDLMRTENEILGGREEAGHAFQVLSGLFASNLEAAVLPGDHLGLFDIWKRLPPGTDLVWVSRSTRRRAVQYMKDNHYPEQVISWFSRSKDIALIPAKPAQIDGRERWAWLAFDPRSYRTISVLDTGEHGSMVEVSLDDWVEQSCQFLVGAFIGIFASPCSVSTFSMVLTDHDEIMKQAEKFASGLSNCFGFSKGNASLDIGSVEPSLSLGHVTFSVNPFDFDGVNVSHDLLGFGSGYKAGIGLYFGNR